MTSNERLRRQVLKYGSVVPLSLIAAGCISREETSETESESFSLVANDQTGDGETVVVESVTAEKDYFLHAHYDDETSSSDTFEAGTTQEDVQIDLDPVIEEDREVRIGIHAEEDGEQFTGNTTRDIEYIVE
ncbi:hypothetical protein SAMN04487967_0784 [Natronorubrum sediminis]|uniref:DUF7282 domain-containing protein n=1 Tax=Natronorubrum sediminis TaxID=640943 RepID=A0A1H6FRJ2_9EURY|nr:hypothetical protein [Natronorubrum sediminis]SEH12384.1 hypothetical protein SAMN04487967_0784 [Natronorubrum sediminis]